MSSSVAVRPGMVSHFCSESCNAWAVSAGWTHDPKRGAGGFDLLPTYFTFPADISVDESESSLNGQVRLPTYKRLPNVDVPACAASSPFMGMCDSNPCRGAGTSTCSTSMYSCFEAGSESKTDVLLSDDPLYSSAGAAYQNAFIKPQVGYLDSFGFSTSMAQSVSVRLFQDRPVLTMGDHGAFVAAVTFSTAGVPAAATGSAKASRTSESLVIVAAIFALMK